MLLKQTAAYIAVQAEGEKFIDFCDSLLQYVCKKHVKKKTDVAKKHFLDLVSVS